MKLSVILKGLTMLGLIGVVIATLVRAARAGTLKRPVLFISVVAIVCLVAAFVLNWLGL